MKFDPGHIIESTPCPKCSADAGEECCTDSGHTYGTRVHVDRARAAPEPPKPTLEDVENGHNALSFVGWRVYNNTGRPYRRWTFKRDVEAVGAAEGYKLDDRGPGFDGNRFQVKDTNNEILDGYSAEDVAVPFFLGVIPDWNPPTGGKKELCEVLKDFTKKATHIGSMIAENTEIYHKWINELRARNTAKGESEDESESPENQYLRLKGEYEYDNGDPYKDWLLKVDAPEIPVGRTQNADPMHAAEGDVLRERDADELTPFQLRRGGSRIGDPEWWQVRHLFEGLEEGKAPKPEDVDPACRRVRQVLPSGPVRWGTAFLAVERVEEVGLRAKDVVLYLGRQAAISLRQKYRDQVSGAIHRLPRTAYQTLSENVHALRYVEGSYKASVEGLRNYLSNGKAQRGRDDTSRVVILRPLVSEVSEPIRARSDNEAIFELMYQTSRADA